MKVICFYWDGDRFRLDNELASEYVNRLYQGVKDNTSKEFDFICFTNKEMDLHEDIEVKPFPLYSNTGVLPRLYAFSEEAGLFGEQVLMIDIDTVIIGSLDDVMSYEGLFCVPEDFYEGGGKLAGGVIGFKAGKEIEDILWTPFANNIKSAEERTQGRERMWFREKMSKRANLWDKVTPNQIQSYKAHLLRGKLSEDARIICFHGRPRPHMINWSVVI